MNLAIEINLDEHDLIGNGALDRERLRSIIEQLADDIESSPYAFGHVIDQDNRRIGYWEIERDQFDITSNTFS